MSLLQEEIQEERYNKRFECASFYWGKKETSIAM